MLCIVAACTCAFVRSSLLAADDIGRLATGDGKSRGRNGRRIERALRAQRLQAGHGETQHRVVRRSKYGCRKSGIAIAGCCRKTGSRDDERWSPVVTINLHSRCLRVFLTTVVRSVVYRADRVMTGFASWPFRTSVDCGTAWCHSVISSWRSPVVCLSSCVSACLFVSGFQGKITRLFVEGMAVSFGCVQPS